VEIIPIQGEKRIAKVRKWKRGFTVMNWNEMLLHPFQPPSAV
jgi:hypothetical protein